MKIPIGYALVMAISSTLLTVSLSRALEAQRDPDPSFSNSQAAIDPRRFPPCPTPSKDRSWRLVASRTTSDAWLYNTRTGRVYRALEKCPNGPPNGCLVPLSAIYGPHRSDDLPSAGDDY